MRKKIPSRASVARRKMQRAASTARQIRQQVESSKTERQAVQTAKRIAGKQLSERERFEIARDAQRLIDKRERQFEAAHKKIRVRKSDPRVVFVLARDQFRTVGHRRIKVASAGERTTRGDRRRVFIFKHTRPSEKYPKGRLVPYQDFEERERLKELRIARSKVAPKPMAIQDFDPNQFGSKQLVKEYYAGRKRAYPTITVQRRVKKPVKKLKPVAQPISFMDNVVPRVAAGLKAAADQHADRREFELDCAAVVRLPDGKTISPRFEVNFKQADVQQFMDLGFYEPFVERKVYAAFAEQLKGLGLVTTGSAQFISRLPVNQGVPRKYWKDSKGFAWKRGEGWKLQECELIRFDAVPNYIIVQSGE